MFVWLLGALRGRAGSAGGGLRRRSGLSAWLAVGFVLPGAAVLGESLPALDHAVEVWGPDKGLPQSSVTSVFQDDRGYLWVGTLEGVARFDGHRFTTGRDAFTSGLPTEPVTALGLDPGRRVWVGTLGLGMRTVGLDGRAPAWESPELPDDRVYAILPRDEGRALLATGRGLVEIVPGQEPRFMGARDGLPGPNVLSLAASGGGGAWIGTNEGLAHLGSEGLVPLDLPGKLVGSPIRALRQGADGRLWIGTLGRGLAALDGEGFSRWGRDEGLENQFVSALLDDGDCLWIGTRGGLFRLCGEERVRRFPPGHRLSRAAVLALTFDREGNLWVGTQTQGLLRVHEGVIRGLTPREGLSDPMVSTVLQRQDGSIVAGTTGRGVTLFEVEGARVIDTLSGLPTNRVTAVLEDRSGTLWIGTSGEGLVEWRDGLSRRYGAATGELASDFVLALFEDRDGSLWVGTNTGGVSRRRGGEWQTWGTADGLPAIAVMALAQGPDGAVWIATQRGLVRLASDGAGFERITLPYGLLTALHVDELGRAWIGTIGGGVLVDDGPGYRAVTVRQGLPSDTVWAILADGEDLWMSSNSGVWRVDREDLARTARGGVRLPPIRVYGEADGLPASECNGGTQPSAWRTRDGRLLFPTLAGVAVVDPSRLSSPAPTVPAVVETVRADGATLPFANRISVPAGIRNLEIDYTAFLFDAPGRVQFRYRLEGYDASWVAAGSRRTAFYTRVPPGRYRFRVEAGTLEGDWTSQGAGLSLDLAPLWFQTRWFRWGSILLVLSLVIAVPTARLRAVERQRRRLEGQVEERTIALRDANERLRHLADRDGLTGLANRRRLDTHLDQEWNRLARSGRPFAVILGDLDAFKAFNDSRGHLAGDSTLKRVAEVFAEHARRPGDLAARYGGEELALLLPETGESAAQAIAHELRRGVQALGIEHPSSPIAEVVTLSLGVAASVPRSSEGAEALLARADEALYRAKADGRNRVAV